MPGCRYSRHLDETCHRANQLSPKLLQRRGFAAALITATVREQPRRSHDKSTTSKQTHRTGRRRRNGWPSQRRLHWHGFTLGSGSEAGAAGLPLPPSLKLTQCRSSRRRSRQLCTIGPRPACHVTVLGHGPLSRDRYTGLARPGARAPSSCRPSYQLAVKL